MKQMASSHACASSTPKIMNGLARMNGHSTRHDYNNVRPHSSLGGLTPAARRSLAQSGGIAPARFQSPRTNHIYQQDSTYERGSQGGQVISSM